MPPHGWSQRTPSPLLSPSSTPALCAAEIPRSSLVRGVNDLGEILMSFTHHVSAEKPTDFETDLEKLRWNAFYLFLKLNFTRFFKYTEKPAQKRSDWECFSFFMLFSAFTYCISPVFDRKKKGHILYCSGEKDKLWCFSCPKVPYEARGKAYGVIVLNF